MKTVNQLIKEGSFKEASQALNSIEKLHKHQWDIYIKYLPYVVVSSLLIVTISLIVIL